MKYSKLEKNNVYSVPESLEKIIFDSGASVPRDTKARIDFVKSLGYLEVKESSFPTPPPELNGKCRIALDNPVMTSTGILERKYKFIPLTTDQVTYMESKNRARRDEILKTDIDTMNPIRWEALTAEQKTAWTEYRQALLDVTNQAGWPANVNWPRKPV